MSTQKSTGRLVGVFEMFELFLDSITLFVVLLALDIIGGFSNTRVLGVPKT